MTDQRQRSPGRPSQSTATADQGERILDAAQALLSAHGFAATRIRSVADRCQVNPALIHYYFGTKQQLLAAVMARILDPLASAVAQLKVQSGSLLSAVVDVFATSAHRQPNMPMLLFREVLLPGGAYQATFLRDYAPRLGGALPALLQQQQQAGRLHPGVDTRFVALHVMALCVFPFLTRAVAQPIMQLPYDDAMFGAYRDQTLALLQSYYENHP